MNLLFRRPLGDSAAAYADFCDGFQANRALDEQPTIGSALAQVSILNALCDSVGEGLTYHTWADVELAKIEKDLSTVALMRRYRLALQSDRAGKNLMYDRYAASTPMGRWKLYTAALYGRPAPRMMAGIKLVPRRFFRDNQLRHNQWTDELLARFDAEATSFDPDGATPSSPRNWDNWFDAGYYFLFRVTAISSEGHDARFLRTQTKLDQTRLAFAIERFHIARASIPGSLAELVPDFIPELTRDVYTGQPMIYRRKETGGFLLYSVGANRNDDGGTSDPGKSETRQPDWVWPYSRD